MAAILVHAKDEPEVDRLYHQWWVDLPRGQFGRPTLTDVRGNPNPVDNMVYKLMDDAFVDTLAGSGIPFRQQ